MALTLIDLRVGDVVKPSPLWRRRYNDAEGLQIDRAAGRPAALSLRPWSGTLAAVFADPTGRVCVVVEHEEEDCGCDWEPDCWRCEGTGCTRRRTVRIEEVERC